MSDCILFEGFIRKDGYGTVSRTRQGKTKLIMAHRMAWAEANGKDPFNLPGWVRVKHTCNISWCIQPDHLYTELSPEMLALLPAAIPEAPVPVGLTKARNTSAAIPNSKLSPGALRMQVTTECAQGHTFRDEPDDTSCRSCRANKMLLAKYEAA